MKRMAVISAGFVPVPAVDGGAGEELTTEIIKGNEKKGDYFMDIYTIESPKLCNIKYKNAEVIQLHISKLNWFFCKARNAFLKLFNRRYRFIPYNRVLLKKFRDNYDLILIENNMQVYEDIYKHMKRSKNNMIYHMHNDIDGTTKPEYLCRYITDTAKVILPVSKYIKNRVENCSPNNITEVFYNCIDTRKFNRNKEFDCNKIKEKYDIEANDFVYMYAGSVYKGKGVLELVKAFKKVSKECNNVKLLIVGSTWYNLIDKDEYYVRLIKEIEDAQIKEVTPFNVGDTIKVHAKIVEGNRERIQIFEGLVLKKQGGSNRATFTVRKNSNGIGVERTWPLYSPNIAKIEVVRQGKVRRAKLNYIRSRVGKAAKVKELVK